MTKLIFFLVLFTSNLPFGESQKKITHADVLQQINKVRSQGCYCGGEYMPATHKLVWNNNLYESARDHAIEMYKYDYFSHISMRGLEVGSRVERFGYKWHFAGENLAKGQMNYKQVIEDWLDSPSHCKMMMDPRMVDTALFRIRNIWVQHFGKQLPPNAKRIKETYSEG